jgi:tRNA (guanine37-N1)-methyltransferase
MLDQKIANNLSLKEISFMICGHYKGIDERIREHFVTKEISIGDYVLSGGELAAAVLVDCIGRLIPGVLNDETSALFDSFQDNFWRLLCIQDQKIFGDGKYLMLCLVETTG